MLAPVTRKPVLALFMSFIMPGLGQIYSGQLIRGGCILIFFCILPLIIMRLTVALPETIMLAGTATAALTALTVYGYALIDSYRLAASNKDYFQPQPYNSVFFYCAAWLAGIALIGLADGYLKTSIAEAYKIVSVSMEPDVLQGDYVLVDKTSYSKQPIQRGDIVIAVYPDDRSKVLIRQITALPGDQYAGKKSAVKIVPHGKVMVKGMTAGSILPLDSEIFGPIDMRDIVGKVVQVYFSKDKDTIRWSRIGTMVNSSQNI